MNAITLVTVVCINCGGVASAGLSAYKSKDGL